MAPREKIGAYDAPVRVSIVRGGGFGGVLTRTILDGSELPTAEREELERRGKAALSVSNSAAVSERTADELLYEIGIGNGSETKTFRLPESQLSPALRDLVTFVDARPETTRGFATPT